MDDDDLSDEVSKFLSGFKLIYSHMKNILENFGVKEVSCLGKIFDANFETSVFMDTDPNYDDEVVLEVLQKGYTYNDKLLRSATVKINKNENKKEFSSENIAIRRAHTYSLYFQALKEEIAKNEA